MSVRTPLRRRVLPTALVAATSLLATLSIGSPALAATSDPAAAQKAGTWLAGELTDAGTVVGDLPGAGGQGRTYTNYGQTLDVALALLAVGGHNEILGRTLTSVAELDAVREYTQGAPGDRSDAAYAGATAKLAFVIEVTGGDAANVGGVDLLTQLQTLTTSDGRFADRSNFGDFANVFGHAFALMALDTAGRAVPAALVQGLLTAQCGDGSFPEAYGPQEGTPCTGSVDATGLVLQALVALDLVNANETQRASSWLKGRQQSDGSFVGQAPVNSTGYAVMGLNATNVDASASVPYLSSQQNPDGALRRGDETSTASDLFATAQALPALAGKTFQTSQQLIARQAIPCAATPVTLRQATITATAPAVVEARATSGTRVDFFGYSRPSTTHRRLNTLTVGRDGFAALTVRPETNTRLYAQQHGCPAGPSSVLNVRTALSIIKVVRNGTPTYTFYGTSSPARPGGLVISLYRLTADGHSVLTSQTRASRTTGSWSVRRTFSGAGRFDFVVRTGQDLQNAPGSSNVRSLLVS
jgi:hypothetical protein